MKKPNGIFITGTDTGVGKTIISAALLCGLKSTGVHTDAFTLKLRNESERVDAVYMKPVQTGCLKKSGQLIAPDLELVDSLADINPSGKERQLTSPYRFRQACSPHLAAALERRNISLSKIMKAFAGLKSRHDFVIVEGAGGILTPLSWQYSMLDVMKSLSLPVILVARPGLGTINHTLLSLRELRRAKLNILGVVLNYSSAKTKGIIEASNKEAVERLGRVPVLAEFPFLGNLQRGACSRKIRERIQNTALKTFPDILKVLQV